MRTRKALDENSFKNTLEGKEFMSPSCGGTVRVNGGKVTLNGYEDVTNTCDWSKLLDEYYAWNIGAAHQKMVAARTCDECHQPYEGSGTLMPDDSVVCPACAAKGDIAFRTSTGSVKTAYDVNDKGHAAQGESYDGNGVVIKPGDAVMITAYSAFEEDAVEGTIVAIRPDGENVDVRLTDGSTSTVHINDIFKKEGARRTADQPATPDKPKSKKPENKSEAPKQEKKASYTDPLTGKAYECFLEDDGTMDTVVSCNGKSYRFQDVERSEGGQIPDEELNRLFDEAIELYEQEGSHENVIDRLTARKRTAYRNPASGREFSEVTDMDGQPLNVGDRVKAQSLTNDSDNGAAHTKEYGTGVITSIDQYGMVAVNWEEGSEGTGTDQNEGSTLLKVGSKRVASERTASELKDADGNDLQEGDTVVVVNDLAKEIFPSLYGQRFTISWTGMNDDRPEIQRLRLSNAPAVGGQGLFAPASFVRKEASKRVADEGTQSSEQDWNDTLGDPVFQVGDEVTPQGNSADPHFGQTGTVVSREDAGRSPEDILYYVDFKDGSFPGHYYESLKKTTAKKIVATVTDINGTQVNVGDKVKNITVMDATYVDDTGVTIPVDTDYLRNQEFEVTEINEAEDYVLIYKEWPKNELSNDRIDIPAFSRQFAKVAFNKFRGGFMLLGKEKKMPRLGDYVAGRTYNLKGEQIAVTGMIVRHEYEDIFTVKTASNEELPVLIGEVNVFTPRFASTALEVADLERKLEILEQESDGAANEDQERAYVDRIEEIKREIEQMEAKTAMTDPSFFGSGLRVAGAEIEEGNTTTLESPSTGDVAEESEEALGLRPRGERGEGSEVETVLSSRRQADGSPAPVTMGGAPEGLEEDLKTAEADLDPNIFEDNREEPPHSFKGDNKSQSKIDEATGGANGHQSGGPFVNPPTPLGAYAARSGKNYPQSFHDEVQSAVYGYQIPMMEISKVYKAAEQAFDNGQNVTEAVHAILDQVATKTASCPPDVPNKVKDKVKDEYGKDNPKTYQTLWSIEDKMKGKASRRKADYGTNGEFSQAPSEEGLKFSVNVAPDPENEGMSFVSVTCETSDGRIGEFGAWYNDADAQRTRGIIEQTSPQELLNRGQVGDAYELAQEAWKEMRGSEATASTRKADQGFMQNQMDEIYQSKVQEFMAQGMGQQEAEKAASDEVAEELRIFTD